MKRTITRIMAISASPPSTAPTMRPILIFDPEELDELGAEVVGEPGKSTVAVNGTPPIVVVCTATFSVVVASEFAFSLGYPADTQ